MDRGAVISRFTVTSALMWTAPLMVLFFFNQRWFTDYLGLSEESTTIFSGLVAVLSVNVVVGVYIFMALRDKPSSTSPQPDPAFLAAAQRSVGERTVGDVQAEQQATQRRSRSKRD